MNSKENSLLFIHLVFCLFMIHQSLETTHKENSKVLKPLDVRMHERPISKALLIGDKSQLSFEHKKILKVFGLTHLFTPSALHLSSLLLFFRWLPQSILSFIVLCLSIYLQIYAIKLESFLRACHFYLIKRHLALNSHHLALALILILQLELHIYSSSLSFWLSFLFWGQVILSSNQRLKRLSLCQFLVSLIFDQKLNYLFILINTLYSFIIISLFPLIALAQISIDWALYVENILNLFLNFLVTLNERSEFEVVGLIFIIFTVYFSLNHLTQRLFIILIIFSPLDLTHKREVKAPYYPKYTINPDKYLKRTQDFPRVLESHKKKCIMYDIDDMHCKFQRKNNTEMPYIK